MPSKDRTTWAQRNDDDVNDYIKILSNWTENKENYLITIPKKTTSRHKNALT